MFNTTIQERTFPGEESPFLHDNWNSIFLFCLLHHFILLHSSPVREKRRRGRTIENEATSTASCVAPNSKTLESSRERSREGTEEGYRIFDFFPASLAHANLDPFARLPSFPRAAHYSLPPFTTRQKDFSPSQLFAVKNET